MTWKVVDIGYAAGAPEYHLAKYVTEDWRVHTILVTPDNRVCAYLYRIDPSAEAPTGGTDAKD